MSVEPIELLSFFEVEPTFLASEDPWPYTDALYEVTQGDVGLSFAVAPAYKDVRIILRRADVVLYELSATAVQDVDYHNDSGRESLEIQLSSRETLWLRLKPHISIIHELRDLERT
jgi:hypothetical protein